MAADERETLLAVEEEDELERADELAVEEGTADTLTGSCEEKPSESISNCSADKECVAAAAMDGRVVLTLLVAISVSAVLIVVEIEDADEVEEERVNRSSSCLTDCTISSKFLSRVNATNVRCLSADGDVARARMSNRPTSKQSDTSRSTQSFGSEAMVWSWAAQERTRADLKEALSAKARPPWATMQGSSRAHASLIQQQRGANEDHGATCHCRRNGRNKHTHQL